MMSLNLPLRILQTVLAIVILAMQGYVTHWYLRHTRESVCPQSPVLLMAVAVVALLTMPYLMFNPPLQITHSNKSANPRYFNKWVVLALDALVCILWFVGWINLASFRAQLLLCAGPVCKSMSAGAALGGAAWLTYLATTAFAALHVLRTRGGTASAAVQRDNHDAWVGTEQKP